MAQRNTQLLELIARVRPEIWEIIHPHVPFVARTSELAALAGLAGRIAAVELNPQPIPPGLGWQASELNPQPLPPRAEVLVAAVGLAQQLAQLAITSNVVDGRGAEILVAEIEDWCGTRPRPIPWPKNWPWPWPPGPDPDPDPHPWLTQEVFTVAAVTLASIAGRLGAGELRAGFETAVDRLVEAALQG